MTPKPLFELPTFQAMQARPLEGGTRRDASEAPDLSPFDALVAEISPIPVAGPADSIQPIAAPVQSAEPGAQPPPLGTPIERAEPIPDEIGDSTGKTLPEDGKRTPLAIRGPGFESDGLFGAPRAPTPTPIDADSDSGIVAARPSPLPSPPEDPEMAPIAAQPSAPSLGDDPALSKPADAPRAAAPMDIGQSPQPVLPRQFDASATPGPSLEIPSVVEPGHGVPAKKIQSAQERLDTWAPAEPRAKTEPATPTRPADIAKLVPAKMVIPAAALATRPRSEAIAPPTNEAAPLPGSLLVLTSPQPVSSSPAPLAAEASATPARQLETLIDNLAQARETGRAVRGDIVVRHAEFGSIAVRIDHAEGDLTARLNSRDPGFAPAAQAALAERTQSSVAAPSDSNPAQNRAQDGASQGQTQRDGTAAQTGRDGQPRENSSQRAHPGERTPHPPPTPTDDPADRAPRRGLLA